MYGLKDESPDPDAPNRNIPADAGQSFMGSQEGTVLKRHIEDIVNNIAKVNNHLPCPKYKVESK
jgi:hypothetical protein